MSIPKRVIFVSGVPVDIGGIERTIMEIYREINRERLLIDFVVRKPQDGYFHNEIKNLGGKIFNIFEKTKHKGNKKWNFLMDIYSVYSFLKLLKVEGPFCAVHIVYPHLDGFLIIAAKMAGVPVRIVHSRNTGFDDNKRPGIGRTLVRKLRLIFCKRYATHIWGCSEEALKYLFGRNIMYDERAEVPNNPIRVNRFISQNCSKIEACKELGIPFETQNYVNVGRYAPQKNQFFLLEFFAEMLKIRNDLHLILTGPGSLETDIKSYISELNIQHYVTMLDHDVDIPLVLSAADFFLLPSLYEGFGNVLIEAQAAGVPCFASDVCPRESDLGLVEYLSLEKGAKYWAEFIVSKLSQTNSRRVDVKRLMAYESSSVGQRMEQVYLEGIKYKDSLSKNNCERIN